MQKIFEGMETSVTYLVGGRLKRKTGDRGALEIAKLRPDNGPCGDLKCWLLHVREVETSVSYESFAWLPAFKVALCAELGCLSTVSGRVIVSLTVLPGDETRVNGASTQAQLLSFP